MPPYRVTSLGRHQRLGTGCLFHRRATFATPTNPGGLTDRHRLPSRQQGPPDRDGARPVDDHCQLEQSGVAGLPPDLRVAGWTIQRNRAWPPSLHGAISAQDYPNATGLLARGNAAMDCVYLAGRRGQWRASSLNSKTASITMRNLCQATPTIRRMSNWRLVSLDPVHVAGLGWPYVDAGVRAQA